MSNELCKCGKVGKISCPNDERCVDVNLPPPMQQAEPTINQMKETIAQFDGWEFHEGDPNHKCNFCFAGDEPCTPAVDRFIKDGRTVFNYELKYYTSWEWLMPVVEKIETPQFDEKGIFIFKSNADVEIHYKSCIIEYVPDKESGDPNEGVKIQTQGRTKLEAVYKAVYQFITWYNQQKQPNATTDPE